MAWADWSWGTGHWGEPDDWDFEDEAERLQSEMRQKDREEREAADRAENKRRRWPPNCGFCGSSFDGEATYGDDDYECVGMPYVYQQGRYECGVEINHHQVAYHDGPGKPDLRTALTFDQRVVGGQTNACRTIMELRWKTDPEALERDRTDSRTERERMPVEDERKLIQEERAEHRRGLIRKALTRMTTTDTWEDAQGVVTPLTDLTHGHLVNIQIWLDRVAPKYNRWARELYWHDRNRQCEDIHGNLVDVGIPPEVHNRMEDDLFRSPLDWVRDKPVYVAVKAAILATAPVDRRAAGYVQSVSATPPQVPPHD